MEPAPIAGTASLGIQLDDLHSEDERVADLDRYIRVVFALNEADGDSRKFTYYPAGLCKDILTQAPDKFWESFDFYKSKDNLDSDKLMCPDVESFELKFLQAQLQAYVMTCSDALDALKTGDPATECEQDRSVIESYINNKIDLNSIWLSQYFNLLDYRAGKEVTWNGFFRADSLIQTETRYYKNY